MDLDLVVIGSGWHGLIATKTYLELNPTTRVLILDKSSTIGGVWAEHRLYPGLKTNNLLGTYEASDLPMAGEHAFGLKPGDPIPGHIVHKYLKAYAEKFNILPLCRFSEDVKAAEKLPDGSGWVLTVEKPTGSGRTHTVSTNKLIVATGLTSEPFLPDFPGARDFEAPILHCGSLLQYSDALFGSATNIVVLGGTKSAWDAAYEFASRGIHVDWIIRESGYGPAWMSPAYVTPFKKRLEKFTTIRALTWFSPCIWGSADGFELVRRLLHSTPIGRLLTRAFWGLLEADVLTINGYDNHPETAKLKPWIKPFWVASGLGILNHPTNFFALVKEGKISVHISDIASLSQKCVHLTTEDKKIHTDALICSTGWKFHPPLTFHTAGKAIDADLGLPHHSHEPEGAEIQQADAEIFSQFPALKDQPILNPKLSPLPSLHLSEARDLNRGFCQYRFMVPPLFLRDKTVGFIGMLQTVTTPMVAQAQALWLGAFLGGRLKVDDDEKRIARETVLHARFGKWRCPGGYGARYPDFAFDALPYIDLLLADLGLSGRRKKDIVSECFEPYGPADYVGLVEEWKRKQKV